jgi:hypothetical protein
MFIVLNPRSASAEVTGIQFSKSGCHSNAAFVNETTESFLCVVEIKPKSSTQILQFLHTIRPRAGYIITPLAESKKM